MPDDTDEDRLARALANDVVLRALQALRRDRELWQAYKRAIAGAEGFDTDFPEPGFDGPVGRLHIMGGRIFNAARQAETALWNDIRGWHDIMTAAYLTAAGEIAEEQGNSLR